MDYTESLRQEDHEILLELLREKQKRDRREKIILIIVLIIAAAFVAGLLYVIPKIVGVYKSYLKAMQYIEDIYKQAGPILKSATDTFAQISKIDFDGLEKTLKDAESIFASIMSIFGG